ncbi:phosphoribosyl-AMP cyclohydrolase [Undibacterium sp. TJN25]|uniref:phosphoribosyl-AMP cyclohydrolase n=1 Tax=Undibacterium sp. TJN25 TaxID=3413056 RepID=UPI003BEFCEB0
MPILPEHPVLFDTRQALHLVRQFEDHGLLPCITRHGSPGRAPEMLTMGWMDKESFRLSMETGYAHYYSQSRERCWHRNQRLGHTQRHAKPVRRIMLDDGGHGALIVVELATEYYAAFQSRPLGSCQALSGCRI